MARAQEIHAEHIFLVLLVADSLRARDDIAQSLGSSPLLHRDVFVQYFVDWCGGLFNLLDAGHHW